MTLLIGHFILPFVLMLPRIMKRMPIVVATMGAWLLVMHWIDVFYLIAPEKGAEHVPFGLMDVVGALGHLGLFVAGIAYTLGGRSLLPEKDPRLAESLAFENV